MSLSTLNSSESYLFIHVLSEWVTTSTIFGNGKTSLVKLFKANRNLNAISDVFCNLGSTVGAVTCAGERMFLACYHATEQDLNSHWFHVFVRSIIKVKADLHCHLLEILRNRALKEFIFKFKTV